MAANRPENPFSKISIIKARLRSETDEDSGADFRETRLIDPPAAGQYVSSVPFRSASPPVQSHASQEASDDGFRAAPPLQGAPTPPRPASPIQKAPSASAARPPAPIQKAPPADPARPPTPIRKAVPAAGQPASPPIQKNPAASAPPSTPSPPPDSGIGTDSADPSAGPVILRPRAASPAPPSRPSSVAGLVTRALGANVNESGVPALRDLAMLSGSSSSDAPAAPPAPETPAAPVPPAAPAQARAPVTRPAPTTPPAASRPTAAPPVPAPRPPVSPVRPGVSPVRIAGASVEAFMEGRTDGASLKERELAIALRNLQNAGWMFLIVHEDGKADTTPIDAAAAYRYVIDEKRMAVDRTDESLRAVDPRARAFAVSNADQLASLDYFHGTGAPTSLRNAPLAKKLQALAASGLLAEGEDAAATGTWGAYVSLVRGGRASLRIEGVEFGEIRGTQPSDVDAAAAPLHELLAIHRDVLVPEAQSGRLHQGSLGQVLQALHYDVPEVTLAERTEAFLRLAEALPPTSSDRDDAAARTSSATGVYEAVLELDVGGEAFWDAVATVETLLGVVGPEQAREPLQYLYREVARSTPFPEARREREEAFRRIIGCGLDPHTAIEITQQVVARPWDEELETRLQLFEALVELGAPQSGYTAIMTDFETVLRFRSSRETLEDAARPYLAIFETLAAQRCAEETARTWAFLHEALRTGHLESEDGSLHDLADRFVALFSQVGNVQEARQRLLHYS